MSEPDTKPKWKTTTNIIEGFDQLSHFLSRSAGDAESAQLSHSMGELAQAIEAVSTQLKLARGSDDALGALLVTLLTALRKHRQVVVGLSPSWRGLYEYAAYLAALNNFRVLIGQWLLERSLSGGLAQALDDFEMIGWRTLGEGILMIDMHEQARRSTQMSSDSGDLDDDRVAQAQKWWSKLRG